MSKFLSYLRLNNISLYVFISFWLSTYPLMDAWVASTFWLFWMVLLWTWVYKYLFKFLLSLFWGIYSAAKLVDSIFIFLRNHMAIQVYFVLCLLYHNKECNFTLTQRFWFHWKSPKLWFCIKELLPIKLVCLLRVN